ncbi:MAG: FkbM family methyltransferase [bacterium]|nr:FkbM family methyltransferase [bacterium]
MRHTTLLLRELLDRIRTIKNWPLFVPPLSRFLTKNCTAILRDGSRIKLRDTHSSDYSVMMEIASKDIYRLKSIKDPSIILDIGANIGVFTILAARRFPNAKVVAVEPQANNFAALEANVHRNKLSNVELHRVAVSDSYGTTPLFIDDYNHGGHSIMVSQHGSRVEQVGTVPLRHFGVPDAIKIDCEGAEYTILKEIPDCKYIGIEIHETGDQQSLVSAIISKGFSVEETAHNVFVFLK